ncbi:MAG: DotI/IcmL/TraM family protein [Gammaproteobacteria bacterium]|nr:DotI/IcmL/TraM family protein [Gammaproteobacteria bacterium]
MKQRSEGLQLVLERNAFYRNNYRRFVAILFVQSVLLLIVSVVLYYSVVIKPTTTYFASTPDGVLIRLEPLTQPLKSNKFVAQWAAKSAQEVFSFDWINFRTQLASASENFTNEGYNSLIKSMNANRYFDLVKERKMIVSAVVTDPPVVVSAKSIAGIFTWQISLRMLVKYQGINESDSLTLPMTVQMRVKRVSQKENIKGIGIDEFQAIQGA